MTAKRALPNVPAPKRRNNPKKALIKTHNTTSHAFTPLDHPVSEHCDEARVPKNTELSPIAFFNLLRYESILGLIVEATNAFVCGLYCTDRHAAHRDTAT